MFSHRFEVSTLLFPFGSLTTHSCYCVVWKTFFDSFSNFFSVELFHSPGVTVTQGSCNVFPLSPSGHCILLLLLESLLTHSHNYVVWTATHFFRFCFTHFLSGTVPRFFCNCYTRSL